MLKKTTGPEGPESETRETMDTLLEELEKLPLAERMQLVEDLWDSIARSREELPIPQWQKDVLECRKRENRLFPDSSQSWDDVKRDILQESQ